MDNVASRLRGDCLVKVYVAENSILFLFDMRPFLVQRERLVNVSATFEDLIQTAEKAAPDAQPILRFPDDSLAAWECFLQWLMQGDIRIDRLVPADPVILIQSWLLGAKYNFPDFQDMAMIALLRHYEKAASRVQVEEIKEAFKSSSKTLTKLKNMLPEEAVKTFYRHKVNLDEFNIDECDGIPGFTRAIIETHQRYVKNKTTFFDRVRAKTNKDKARWEEFLLNTGLKTLWQRDDKGVPKAGKRKHSEVD